MNGLYGAIDLGGTNVRAIVATLDGEIRGDDRRGSRAANGLEATLDAIEGALRQACAEAGVREPAALEAVGIASPGWVDLVEGVVPAAPQLKGWRDVPIVRLLGERFGTRVVLENDANAAALGEHVFGAGRGVQNMVYITVSTGIGGGIIADGRLYGGARGAAGEIGHTVVDPAGPVCPCGSRGCLEILASGTAIARRAAEVLERKPESSMARLRDGEGRLSARRVAEAARAGDADASAIFAEAGRYLGIALGNVVNLLSPEAIVIGGGVALGAGDLLLPPAEATMREVALDEPLKYVRVVPAGLGDNGGVMGMIARMRGGSSK